MIDNLSATDPALRVRVRDFNDDYVAALDDLDFGAWVASFTEDCHYRVVSQENFVQGLSLSTMECQGIGSLRDRVAALGQTSVFEPRLLRRMVSAVQVLGVEAGEVIARANFAILESQSDRETQVFLAGRYLDRLVVQGGQLKLRQRLCVFDNYRIRTSLVYPV